jgi:hypothetical protein
VVRRHRAGVRLDGARLGLRPQPQPLRLRRPRLARGGVVRPACVGARDSGRAAAGDATSRRPAVAAGLAAAPGEVRAEASVAVRRRRLRGARRADTHRVGRVHPRLPLGCSARCLVARAGDDRRPHDVARAPAATDQHGGRGTCDDPAPGRDRATPVGARLATATTRSPAESTRPAGLCRVRRSGRGDLAAAINRLVLTAGAGYVAAVSIFTTDTDTATADDSEEQT